MQQEARESARREIGLLSGGGEEEREDKAGREHKQKERHHVLHNLNHDSEKHSGALKEGEEEEDLHSLAQTEQSQEECLRGFRGCAR